MSNYEKMSDEQLIRRFREGDTSIMDYIMNKYKFLVKQHAKAMFLLGGENDDLIQEGMIGLNHAIDKYQEMGNTLFYTYAKTYIVREIQTLIRDNSRYKHK